MLSILDADVNDDDKVGDGDVVDKGGVVVSAAARRSEAFLKATSQKPVKNMNVSIDTPRIIPKGNTRRTENREISSQVAGRWKASLFFLNMREE